MDCGLGLIQRLLWLGVGARGEGKNFSKVWAEISGLKVWEPLLIPCCRVYHPYIFSCLVQSLPRSVVGLMPFSRAEGDKVTVNTSKKWNHQVKLCSSSWIKCKNWWVHWWVGRRCCRWLQRDSTTSLLLINKSVVPPKEEGYTSSWDACVGFAKTEAHLDAVLLCPLVLVSHLLNVVGLWYSANENRMKGSGEPECWWVCLHKVL